ncbi:beta-amylase 2, chloroplastic isoform X3 [Cinnamomum micranthum f. kanehirae]|uniref:Beta-amylase n=1 Tax=Cinnamomum micranthum f. kanehirae TaxID=337451 RepID=A0A443PM07_9MAGN|nr:beta-amylase 2, chloroplastic isoform X3 [Cinnamomum micranthum f. kanehirae]
MIAEAMLMTMYVFPSPHRVTEIGRSNPDIYFTDREGRRNLECLTWGIEKERVSRGRIAVELISMQSTHADPVLHFSIDQIIKQVSGIHWWYKTASHAAELAAGFYNPCNRDGYASIAAMLKKHEASLNFTCVELRTLDQHEGFPEALTDPEGLVLPVLNAAWDVSIPVASENALPCHDRDGYNKILENAKPMNDPNGRHLSAFTYLRLRPTLLERHNFSEFERFVKRMHGKQLDTLCSLQVIEFKVVRRRQQRRRAPRQWAPWHGRPWGVGALGSDMGAHGQWHGRPGRAAADDGRGGAAMGAPAASSAAEEDGRGAPALGALAPASTAERRNRRGAPVMGAPASAALDDGRTGLGRDAGQGALAAGASSPARGTSAAAGRELLDAGRGAPTWGAPAAAREGRLGRGASQGAPAAAGTMEGRRPCGCCGHCSPGGPLGRGQRTMEARVELQALWRRLALACKH